MKLTLNGWRRLGIVLVAIWLIGILAVVILEVGDIAEDGIFVYQGIPIGTEIRAGEVHLPDGKVVPIDDIDPTTGRRLAPWEIDWSKQAEVPSITYIRWLRLSLAALFMPLITWIFTELAVIIAAWIARGFKSTNSVRSG